MWNQGMHGRSGVTCVDCHMPKDPQGPALTDHWVRSPVLNLKDACVSCHKKHDANDHRGTQGARRGDPGPALGVAPEGHGRGGGADRRPEGGEGGRKQRRGPPRRPLSAAPRAVLSRLRRSGELHRLPCASGGGAHPRRIDRLRAPGPARPARHVVQADDSGGRHSATPAREEDAWPRIRNRTRRPASRASWRAPGGGCEAPAPAGPAGALVAWGSRSAPSPSSARR